MNDNAVILPFFVAAPLAGAFINALLGRRIPGLSDFLGSLLTLILMVLSLTAVRLLAFESTSVYLVGGWKSPIGIVMVLDGLTAFMLVTVNTVAFAITMYARNYMNRYTAKELFYTLLLLLLTGMNGVIIAGDVFNLFVFLEIAAMASYALVAFGTERHELEAAFKYAVMGTVGSLFILLGIVLLYSMTSTLNMADMHLTLTEYREQKLILMVSVLFLTGFGLKAAIVPFHGWLPDAHPAAPAPISAMLSGVVIKSLGLYALGRLFFQVIGVTPKLLAILMILGTLSMVVGALLALGQRDLKRLLAYSSISQVGYIVFGLGLGSPLSILGALFHLLNHSVSKALLFLDAGAVEYATGSRDLHLMGGLGKRMPITGTTSFLAALSIAGVPPLGGFWSKLLIIMAAVQGGHVVYASVAVMVSVLTLALFVGVMKNVFLGELHPRWQAVQEVPLYMRLSMVILALISVAGGVLLLPNLKESFLHQATAILLRSSPFTLLTLKSM